MISRSTIAIRSIVSRSPIERCLSTSQIHRAPLNESDINHFQSILGQNGVKTRQTDDLTRYNEDWLRMTRGSSECVLLPSTVDQVSSILSHCHKRRLHSVFQSGNTSLVAGANPVDKEIVIGMERLNRILSFDEISGVLQCEAGCILEILDNHVAQYGYTMPYDLGAKGSCMIGGNVSTNAGGVRFLRYGSLHGSVLGLKTVLADGRILDLMNVLRKDNTGYDMKQLFIGAEGTLGAVAEVSIACPMRPKYRSVSLLALNSFEDLLKTFLIVRRELNEYLTAFEMMDSIAFGSVIENLSNKNPLGTEIWPFYALIEISANDQGVLDQRLAQVIDQLMEREELVHNGTQSTDEKSCQELWTLREEIAIALLMDGYTYKYDFSIPIKQYYDLVTVMRERLGKLGHPSLKRVCGYGHLGDQNLHFNVTSSPGFCPDILASIEPFVYEWVKDVRGSISAEHGLGSKKRNQIYCSKTPEAVDLMKQIKNLLDPEGLLCPNKLLPD